MKKQVKCYKCDNESTSREHVPPLCFFPEKKDFSHYDLRRNLITVPSCDDHNSKKSKDDEFLMASLTGIVGNNFVGYFHTQTKVKRILNKKGKTFLSILMKDAKEHTIKSENGESFPVLIGLPHLERLIKCFEHIAFGLYYAEFGTRFDGECVVFPGFLNYQDENTEKIKIFCKKRFEYEGDKLVTKGANPEIFKYQFVDADRQGLIALKLTFYGGTDVFISFRPVDSPEPFDLGIALIYAGIKSTVILGDEKIEFN